MTKAWSKGWGRTRLRIYARDQGICQVCHKPILPGEKWDLDHIIPRSEGGPHTDTNLRLAHKGCNSRLGALLVNARRAMTKVTNQLPASKPSRFL